MITCKILNFELSQLSLHISIAGALILYVTPTNQISYESRHSQLSNSIFRVAVVQKPRKLAVKEFKIIQNNSKYIVYNDNYTESAMTIYTKMSLI